MSLILGFRNKIPGFPGTGGRPYQNKRDRRGTEERVTKPVLPVKSEETSTVDDKTGSRKRE